MPAYSVDGEYPLYNPFSFHVGAIFHVFAGIVGALYPSQCTIGSQQHYSIGGSVTEFFIHACFVPQSFHFHPEGR